MEWTVYRLGRLRWGGKHADPPGVLLELDRDQARRLASDGLHEHAGEVPFRPALEQGPFTCTKRGRKQRLAWQHGSIEIPDFSEVETWQGRYGAIVDRHGLIVIDATGDRVARLAFARDIELGWRSFELAATDARLWIATDFSVYAIPLVDLEQLAASKNRSVSVTLHTEYPLRRPDATLACVYLWRLQNGRTMVEIGDGRGSAHEPKLTIDLSLTLAKYAPLMLADELVGGLWARADVPGYPPQQLRDPDAPRTLAGKLRVTRAEHPEGEDRPVVARAGADQRARIDQLVAAICNEPDDDGHRAVLVDLLQELEDPAAPAFAAMRAGTDVADARKKAALGPLAPYLVDVKFRGGLPIAATLSRSAPRDLGLVAAAVADYRLGLLTSLRIGLGAEWTYTQLVAAPRATALVDVDIPHAKTIAALIAVNRDNLVRLGHLELTKKPLVKKLAVPTFDRARTLHAVIDSDWGVDVWLDAIVADPNKMFSRVPRRIELDEARDRHDALRRVLQPWIGRLPVSLAVGGVELG